VTQMNRVKRAAEQTDFVSGVQGLRFKV
jgi:hypothetical protein